MWDYQTNVPGQTFPKGICYDRTERRSNLPFQIALYVNLWHFPIWFLISVISLDAKYEYLTNIYKALTVSVFLVLSFSEGLKLYLGYLGNLSGKIPELAGCWLILAFIELPLEIFLLFDHGVLLRYNEAFINYSMTCLLFLEIITGARALKHLTDCRAKVFYFMQLYDKHDKS